MKILILGVGNILMQDEGIGVHIINRLKEERLASNVDIIDGGTAGFELIDIMEGYNRIFILDAIDAGMQPGEAIVFTPEDVKDRSLKNNYSMHGYGLLTILKVAEFIDKRFNIKLIGIQKFSTEYKIGLSRELMARLPETVEFVKGLL